MLQRASSVGQRIPLHLVQLEFLRCCHVRLNPVPDSAYGLQMVCAVHVLRPCFVCHVHLVPHVLPVPC